MRGQVAILILCAAIMGSCTRSSREVWEDTKTCSRYVKKGVRSLCGQHVDSRDYAGYYNNWQDELEFEPLADAEEYQTPSMHDYAASKESPGDPGCSIPGIDGFKDPSGQLAYMFKNIHFDTDNYSIRGSESVNSLREIAHYLTSHPNTYIFVEGHADERGAAAYNLALGSRRANSVRSFLIESGVNPDQLFTISFGKEKPITMGHDELAWHENRRAQFKIYDK